MAGTATSATATGLTANTAYKVRVRAAAGASAAAPFSANLVSNAITTAPATPSGLTVSSVSDTAITVTWTNVATAGTGATGVNVQYCTGAGCSTFGAAQGSPFSAVTTTATISSLTASTAYTIRVQAAGSTYNSTWQTSASTTTGPSAPTSLTTSISSSSITLTWVNNGAGIANNQVSYCLASSCPSGVGTYTVASSTVGAAATTYTVTGLTSNTAYYVRVRALGATNNSTWLTSGSLTTATAVQCTAANTNNFVLDYGQHAANTAPTSQRGVWSDLHYIPTGTTTYTSASAGSPNGTAPIYTGTNAGAFGVAYVDTNAQALKYTYWNGSTFKTEVVAGDAVANMSYVQLAYLSNSPNTGLPVIYWINGTAGPNILMAVRSSSSLSATGTWTVSVIDANAGGAANRALAVAVSPIDQVGLVYQNSANAIRYINCNANCNVAGNYVAMANGATLDAGLATQFNLGIGWCQWQQGSYYPMTFYGTAATTVRLAACQNANYPACTTSGQWTLQTTPFATAAGGVVNAMLVDGVILKDIPKMITRGTSGIYTGLLGGTGTTTCDAFAAATTTAIGANFITASGAANVGTSQMKILKSSDYTTLANDKFHIIFNDGTTALRWVENNAAWTSTTATWYAAASATVSNALVTTTLGTAGAYTFGADININTGQILSSVSPNITNWNLLLAVLNGFVYNATTVTPATAINQFYQIPVEDTGAIQLNATQYQNTAIAYTSTSQPGAAWVDFSSGLATTGKLKYALRSSATYATGAWDDNIIPGVLTVPGPQFPSLAYDNNNKPWIGYWDVTAARFYLATNTSSDGSGVWTTYPMPIQNQATNGAPAGQPAQNMTAVAMYVNSTGSTANGCPANTYCPVMIVLDNGTTLAVRSSMLNPANGVWTNYNSIVTLSAQGASFLTADWNTQGTIAIAYQDLTTGAVRVKYAASTNGGNTWPTNASAPATVSNLAMGEGAVVKLSPVTPYNPSISYYDRANNKLYYAACTANCTGTGNPTFTGTGTYIQTGLGISGLSATGNIGLLTASLSFDSLGYAYLLFNSGAAGNGALQMINSTAGAMSTSSTVTTLVSGANGNLSAIAPAATNGGVPWNQVSARAPNGNFGAVYVTPGNWLGVTTCGD